MPGPKLVFISTKLADSNRERINLDGDFDPDTNLEEGIDWGDYIVVTDADTIQKIKEDPRFNQHPMGEMDFSAPTFANPDLAELNRAFWSASQPTHDDEQNRLITISRVAATRVNEGDNPKTGKETFETVIELKDADLDEGNNGQTIYPKFLPNILALK